MTVVSRRERLPPVDGIFAGGPQRLTVGAERDGFGTLVATRCTMYNLNRTMLPSSR